MSERVAITERRWTAVVERDATADGTFFYGVRSTGVVCRPGCALRTPRRGHVAFFDTLEEAEREGYRPCRRCTPGELSRRSRLEAQVVRACRRLEHEEPEPTLDALAAEAIYDAGFGSTSRAYEGVAAELGMAPSAYRKGGVGLTIHYGVGACSLGWLVVAATDRGVCAIEFDDDAAELPARLRARFPEAHLEDGVWRSSGWSRRWSRSSRRRRRGSDCRSTSAVPRSSGVCGRRFARFRSAPGSGTPSWPPASVAPKRRARSRARARRTHWRSSSRATASCAPTAS